MGTIKDSDSLNTAFKEAFSAVQELFITHDYSQVMRITGYIALLETKLTKLDPTFKEWMIARKIELDFDDVNIDIKNYAPDGLVANVAASGVLAINEMPEKIKDELVEFGFLISEKAKFHGKEIDAFRIVAPDVGSKLLEDPRVRARMSKEARSYLQALMQKIVDEIRESISDKLSNDKGNYAKNRSSALKGDTKQETSKSNNDEDGKEGEGDAVAYFRRC